MRNSTIVKDLRIETERLIIRPYTTSDLEQSFHLMQDKELFTFLEFDVMSYDDYVGLFHWLIQSYETTLEEDFKYSFAILSKDTNTMIGWCGVGGLDFNKDDKEVFYLIGREHWNMGFASEAISAFVQYCFNTLNQHRLVAKVNKDNIASKKIIERLGFKFQYALANLPDEYSHCNGELYYSLSRR
jgi:ribosomal-protein-alanine N-acetyltransferase